ncbi:hypothetical protein D7Y07_13145 [Bacteroides acidifaciens]|uniref:Uncharacterized protein n=1 Tax=Bacteroides acidifaciens TaxID=85831 RepID=A0A3L7Z200_9BACE|nr:hypothetical protein D7Y07_13145 [Bacteroides acidifaciens]
MNQKREIHIVRANACPHYAIILALIAESTMNKGIGRRYESMRAKREIIPVRGLRKLNLGENYERGILSFLMKVSKDRHWLNLLNERRKT